MKKPKLDLSKVKTLLIQHAEKIVFGIFVVVLLYLTYSGFTLEKFDKTPTDLQSAAQSATSYVANQTFDQQREEMVFVDPTVTVAQNNVQIDAVEFPLAPMNPPVFAAAGKRGEPVYLPVEDMEVAAGFGTFQLKQGGQLQPPGGQAGNSFGARRWISVLGLIPYQRQMRAYHEQFAKHGGAEPEWVAYSVERAEISGAPDAPPTWQRISPSVAAREQQLWAARAAETVPAEFQIPLPKGRAMPMLYPLGPLVGQAWKPEETIPAKIRAIMASEAPAAAPVAGAAAQPAPAAPADVPADDDMGIFAPEPAGGPKPDAKPAGGAAAKPLRDMRAFRFLDFDVEPGKRYRYRVTLYLANPNLGQPTRDLVDPKLAEGPYRTSPPSAPSPEITVPHDAGILIVSIEKARGANEIGANLIVRQRDQATGATILGRRTARRGEEINFRAGEDAEVTMITPGKAAPERLPNYNFRTDTLVVDVVESAGEARVLLLGPDGQLSVRNQAADAEAVLKEESNINGAQAVNAPEPIAAGGDEKPPRGGGAVAPGGSLLPAATPR